MNQFIPLHLCDYLHCSSCSKVALSARWTHDLRAQSVRDSEWNSVVLVSTPTEYSYNTTKNPSVVNIVSVNFIGLKYSTVIFIFYCFVVMSFYFCGFRESYFCDVVNFKIIKLDFKINKFHRYIILVYLYLFNDFSISSLMLLIIFFATILQVFWDHCYCTSTLTLSELFFKNIQSQKWLNLEL